MNADLLILDPMLTGYGGHPFNYDTAVAAAAGKYFKNVEIATGESFTQAEQYGMQAVFSDANAFQLVRLGRALMRCVTLRKNPGAQGRGGAEQPASAAAAVPQPPRLHNSRFSRLRKNLFCQDAWQFLEPRIGADDQAHILLPTVEHPFALGVETVAKKAWQVRDDTMFHLIFRLEPLLHCARACTYEELTTFLLRLYGDGRGRVRFYVDTTELRESYEALCGGKVPFHVLPIPVYSEADAYASFHHVRTNASEQIRLGFMGPPRWEKGLSCLPELLRAVPAELFGRRVTFVIQGVGDTVDSEMERMFGQLRELANMREGAKVELIPGSIPPDEYMRICSSLDCMVLPYDEQRYRCSSSGVLVEAMAFGLPVLSTSRTWMANVLDSAVERVGSIGRHFSGTEDFCVALQALASELDTYKTNVRLFYKLWCKDNNLDKMMRLLLGCDHGVCG